MIRDEVISLLVKLNIKPYDDAYDIERKLRGIHTGFRISVTDGSSKVCLIFKDLPFVVKWSTEDYGEAKREAEIYKKALANGLAKFFPATAHIATINGVDFVAQEKVDFSCCHVPKAKEIHYQRIGRTTTDQIYRKIQKDFYKADHHNGYGRVLDRTWAGMIISLYGKKVCKALCEFVIENAINDLHEANIGYKNDRPIILDFSGYNRD
jgi:hypothetical protein